jgi:hypothetical protein
MRDVRIRGGEMQNQIIIFQSIRQKKRDRGGLVMDKYYPALFRGVILEHFCLFTGHAHANAHTWYK